MSSPALLPTASAAATRRVARELARRYSLRAGLTLVVLVAGTAAGMVVPPLLGRIVDLVVDGQPAAAITAPALLLAVTILGGTLTALGTWLVARVGGPMLATLRERVVERVLALPLGRSNGPAAETCCHESAMTSA